jgi:iron-sulfur cluster repair protein YtfE (RIC family)
MTKIMFSLDTCHVRLFPAGIVSCSKLYWKMSDAHLVDVTEFSALELCDYLEHKFYKGIRQLMQTIHHYVETLSEDASGIEQSELFSLLFLKLEDQTMQMIRNDEIIIFPLIRNEKEVSPCPARKLPLEMIRQMHQKIMTQLEKIRQQANNYIAKPGWHATFKICCGEMYNMEQQLQKAIYIKENVLLHKVKDAFNQPCGGNCSH